MCQGDCCNYLFAKYLGETVDYLMVPSFTRWRKYFTRQV